MGRTVAVIWHALFSIAAGVLYFFFVLPRWPELSYDTPHSLGTALRIVTGALIGLAALPVVFTWLRTRKPEYGTPQMALTLRLTSTAFHVLAGVLIIGTAISEIWFSLDDAGRWLFGIYGAAAAIAILGIFAFYLAFLAELPPPPPRPLKSKERKRRGRRKKAAEEAEGEETTEEAEGEEISEAKDEAEERPEEEQAEEQKPAEVTAEDEKPAEETAADEEESAEGIDDVEPVRRGLRNRRPSGKTETSRRRRRSRGGVAVED
jgi:hypothetical protein